MVAAEDREKRGSSLKTKLLLPILLAGLAACGVAAWTSHHHLTRGLEQQARKRAQLIASSINHTAETVGSTRELQRIVAALGEDGDVTHILVAAGTPAVVVASTSPEQVGVAVTELPGGEHYAGLKSVLESGREAHRDLNAGHDLEYVIPLTVSEVPESPIRHETGAVLVHVDAVPIRAEVTAGAWRISAQVLAVGLGLTALTYLLLHGYVVRPVARIRDAMARRAGGDRSATAPVQAQDEIGGVARSLNEMLSALARAEGKYRSLFEHSPDGVMIVDPETAKVLEANEPMCTILGVKLEELVGRRIAEFEAAETPEEVDAHIRRILERGGDEFETRLRTRDGRSPHVVVRVRVIDVDGKRLLQSVVTDVTAGRGAQQQLRESEERLRFAQECAEAGSWDWDVRTGRVSWSEAYFRLRGLDPAAAEASYEAWAASIHDDDRERVMRAFREMMTDPRGRLSVEYRIVHPARGVRWLADNGRIVYDAEGRPARLAGVAIDVTDRKRFEDALRESERRYKQLVEEMRVIAWEADPMTSRFLYVSRHAESILGYRADEWTGDSFWIEHIHPEDRRRVVSFCEEAAATGAPFYELEYRMLARDGRAVWIRDLTSIDRSDPARRILRGIFVDVSAAKELEGAVRSSEQRLRAIIDNAPDVAVQGYDIDGRVVFWNRGAETIFGWTAQEAIGKTLDQLMLDEQAFADFRGVLREIARTGKPTEPSEWEIRHRSGTPGWVYSSVFPIPVDGGTQFVCMDVNVTARKRAEEERRELEEKLRHAQKLESLGVLAGGIAHDFNNLLVGILGNAGVAREQLEPGSPAAATIATIEQSAVRAAELTQQMLAYSGRGRFRLEAMDLTALVTEMIQLLEMSISKSAAVNFRLRPDLPPTEGDATQIRQVVMNLLTNASDALDGKPGTITITTDVMRADRAYLAGTYVPSEAPEGEYVFVEVSDSGVGMDTRTVSKIFDPFFTTKFTGRGLGLAAVLGIVRGHAGAIKVVSAPGKGTAIRVLLPKSTRASGRAETAPLDAPLRAASGTVLVVDDESLVRDMVRKSLEIAGYTVLVAENGARAVETFRTKGNDVGAVLLDLTMPAMSGEEVLRAIRELRPGVHVILTSGFAEQEVLAKFTNEEPVDFLQKPFTVDMLLHKLAGVMSGAPSGR